MKDSGIDLASFVASSGRSKAKNTKEGGHPESHHLYGEAVDINGEGYQWLKANGKRFGWQYVYNHNPDSAHFKYVGAKAGSTPILSEPGKDYAGGNSLEGHIGEGSREGSREDDTKNKKSDKVARKKGKSMLDMFGKASSSKGMTIGGQRGGVPASQFQEKREKQKLANQTKERNQARQQVTEKSQEMIKEVMAAVAQQNGVNSQAIQAAQQALASVAGQTGAGNPTMIPSSSSGIGSIASTLQSTLNPLRGLLR